MSRASTKRRHSIPSNPTYSSSCCQQQQQKMTNSTQLALELCRLSVQDDSITTSNHHSYYPPSPSSSCSSPSQIHHNHSRNQQPPPHPHRYNRSANNNNNKNKNRPRSCSLSTRQDVQPQPSSLVPTLLYPFGYLPSPYIAYPNNWWFPNNNNNNQMFSYTQANNTNNTTTTALKDDSSSSSSPPTPLVYNGRRMPYSLGADLLDLPAPVPGKDRLSQQDSDKLTKSILNLYNHLLPSESSNQRRQGFLKKLQNILLDAWPEKKISLHTFGSTESLLASSESDLDVCIMTSENTQFQDVNGLCSLLVSKGMKRILCIPNARVPIVRIWDSEFQVSCDLNFNHPQALENTRLIKTYMLLDDRIRPLAMTIKYWTKRRLLNNAAYGGTLSSYTWLCMIINFLQTRRPNPILPSLQMESHKDKVSNDGVFISFCDDIDRFKSFTRRNNSSIGELFFDFFKFYGYQFDYSNLVLSVRNGTHIQKREKGWHLVQNNQLGVEEPFDTSRNLGNTADDISIKGIQLEFQRVYKLFDEKIDLDACLEEYHPPPDLHRRSEPINNNSRHGYNRNDHHAAFLPIMYPTTPIVPWGVDYFQQLQDGGDSDINNYQQQPVYGYYPNSGGWYMPFTNANTNTNSPQWYANGYYWNNKQQQPSIINNTRGRRYNNGNQQERTRKATRARSSLSSSPRQGDGSNSSLDETQQGQESSCHKASSGGYIPPHFSDGSDDVDSFDLSPHELLPHTPPMEEEDDDDDVVTPSVKSYASVAGNNVKQSERSRSCSNSNGLKKAYWGKSLSESQWDKGQDDERQQQQQQHTQSIGRVNNNCAKNNKWSVSMSRKSRKQQQQQNALPTAVVAPVASAALVHDETIKGG